MSAEYNPYSAPTSAVADPIGNPSSQAASQGRRLGTFLIDYVCFIGLSMLVGILVVVIFGKAGAEVLKNTPQMLMGTLLLFIFYGFFEGIWSRTPGKFLLGTVVVNELGGKPTFAQTLGRTLCRFIPFEPFSFFGSDGGWHDRLSKTRVVLKRKS